MWCQTDHNRLRNGRSGDHHSSRAICMAHVSHGLSCPAQARREGSHAVTSSLQQRSELLTWVGSMVNHGDMKAYSEDLRQKVVEAVEQRGTTSKSEAARLFGISLSSVKRYTRLASQGESLTPRKGGGRPPIADEMTRTLLEEDIRARPAATVKERRHFLESFAGKTMSEPTLRRLLKRMGFSRKKGVWGRWNETNGKEQPGE
jgi:transposase